MALDDDKIIKPGTIFKIPANKAGTKPGEDGGYTVEYAQVALLQDIRSELQKLNKTLKEASIFVNGKVG